MDSIVLSTAGLRLQIFFAFFPKRDVVLLHILDLSVTFKPVVCHEANALLPHKCLSSASVQGACLSERRLCRTGFGTVGVPAHRNTECINPRPEPREGGGAQEVPKVPLVLAACALASCTVMKPESSGGRCYKTRNPHVGCRGTLWHSPLRPRPSRGGSEAGAFFPARSGKLRPWA